MADKIKPHAVDRVKKIRAWELKNNYREAQHIKGFKKYKNYFVPESIVKSSKTVLSFGVGGNVAFEKLVAFENTDIHVEMYDPTPRSIFLIKNIINASGRKTISQAVPTINLNKQVTKRLHFNPIAYGKENGILPFYYDPAREPDKEEVNGQKRSKEDVIRNQEQSFSLVKRQELWWEFGNELLDKKIDFKFLAMELELNFEKDEKVEPALEKAQILCDKFKANNYDVVINRRRDKLMLEMLFIRKDAYEG